MNYNSTKTMLEVMTIVSGIIMKTSEALEVNPQSETALSVIRSAAVANAKLAHTIEFNLKEELSNVDFDSLVNDANVPPEKETWTQEEVEQAVLESLEEDSPVVRDAKKIDEKIRAFKENTLKADEGLEAILEDTEDFINDEELEAQCHPEYPELKEVNEEFTFTGEFDHQDRPIYEHQDGTRYAVPF